jgi:hypothetical protein
VPSQDTISRALGHLSRFVSLPVFRYQDFEGTADRFILIWNPALPAALLPRLTERDTLRKELLGRHAGLVAFSIVM